MSPPSTASALPVAAAPAAAASSRRGGPAVASRALKAAAASWFVVAALGQLMFVAYLVGFYGRTAVQGQTAAWDKVLFRGLVAGDGMGNAVLSTHLAFAAFITVGGIVQLIGGVRRRFPRFHRWNGRAYLLLAVAMSLGGLLMEWMGRGPGDLSQHVAISVNAVLILACAAMALRHALARRFDVHRRWALRLFLVVSGVWFFRLGLTLWILLNQGPVGFDPDTFVGPALTILAFAQYLLPLAVLELYFRTQDRAGPRGRIAMTAGLAASTLLTAAGIVAASIILWLPQL